MRQTSLTAARSQLVTAIDLFFDDRDPVSIFALAGNAREILERLCRLDDVDPITELLLRDRPGQDLRDVYPAMNLYRHCFKQVGDTEAERAGEQTALDQFDDGKNEYLIYLCVEDYMKLRKAMPLPFQVFEVWFCALHTELLKLGHVDMYTRAFPNLHQLNRQDQKRVAAAKIREISSDPEVLADPRTEPLILPE